MIGFIVAFMLLFSSLAFAAGGKECGDNADGPAGSTSGGTPTQNRAPNPD